MARDDPQITEDVGEVESVRLSPREMEFVRIQTEVGDMARWLDALRIRALLVGFQTEQPETDPLPPIEDLDEGSHCCGQTFETFAAYMTHRRTHG